MAVAKSRVSKAKRDKKRWTHAALKHPQIATDQTSGEKHLRHHITEQSYYRGREMDFERAEEEEEKEKKGK